MARRTGLAGEKTGAKTDGTGPGDVPPGVMCDAWKTPGVEDYPNSRATERVVMSRASVRTHINS